MAKSKMNAKQRKWCRMYQETTTFEPLMDDFEAGEETFREAALKSILWFEHWSGDAIRDITNLPEGDDAP